jgi:hypothetical protein
MEDTLTRIALTIVALLISTNISAQTLMYEGKPLREVYAVSISFDTENNLSQEVTTNAKPDAMDKKFVATAAMVHGMMIADLWSTYRGFRICDERGYICKERNLLAKPFVYAGPTQAYIAGTATEAGAMYLAYKMRGSRHKWLRNAWPVVPSIFVSLHTRGLYVNLTLFRGEEGQTSSIRLEDLPK